MSAPQAPPHPSPASRCLHKPNKRGWSRKCPLCSQELAFSRCFPFVTPPWGTNYTFKFSSSFFLLMGTLTLWKQGKKLKEHFRGQWQMRDLDRKPALVFAEGPLRTESDLGATWGFGNGAEDRGVSAITSGGGATRESFQTPGFPNQFCRLGVLPGRLPALCRERLALLLP